MCIRDSYNGIARIGDTDIILSTLWSRIPLEDAYFTEQVISDFRRILYKGELRTHAPVSYTHLDGYKRQL